MSKKESKPYNPYDKLYEMYEVFKKHELGLKLSEESIVAVTNLVDTASEDTKTQLKTFIDNLSVSSEKIKADKKLLSKQRAAVESLLSDYESNPNDDKKQEFLTLVLTSLGVI